MKTIHVPGDKSLTHRALLLAALASGRSSIRGALIGADTRSTADALRLLGVAVPALEPERELVIAGAGLHGLRMPSDLIDCGNSGTTARLLLGILAAHPFAATLTGDASLRSRPMRRVTEPLRRMGARFDELERPDRLPVTVHGGSLHGIDHESEHASAQVKSAILLAGLNAGVRVSVHEPILSRDHTERMLDRMGVVLHRHVRPDGSAHVTQEVVERLAPLDFDVPADFSSAAFALAGAALCAAEGVRVPGVGVNPTRSGFLDVLRRMGAHVAVSDERESGGEPIADLTVRRAELQPTRIEPGEVPSLIDELPVIAALAARADGTTIIEGAGELRVKESDRIAAVVENLRAIGVIAEELPDGMVIQGTTAPLRGRVTTRHDHRIAMAFGLLAAEPGNAIDMDDPRVVDVSYPGFWSMVGTLAPSAR